MEAIAVQDNGTEASHGTTMEDISMDERAAIVEGTETCQGELTIEDGSVGNGTIDADGAQSHRAERVSDAHGAQVVGGNGSMDSGGIVGTGARAAAVTPTKKKKKKSKRGGIKSKMTGDEWKKWQRDHGQG